MKKTFLLLIITLVTNSVYPQANKSNKNKSKTTETQLSQEEIKANELFEEMLANTQKITIIDSMVVDRDKVPEMIPLPAEYGKIISYNKFFNITKETDTYVFINGFGNKCYYSEMAADSTYHLYTRDNLNGIWSKPQPIEGIDIEFSKINYPYMTSDGSTLYFSARTKEGLGGYDIFVTGYDSEKGHFLQAENMGLPFNSFSDDFFYIEDDTDGIAWFATTRRQPAGKACIYTILLSNTRQNYDTDVMEEEEIRNLASITSIRNTWENTEKRQKGMDKLKKLSEMRYKNNRNITNSSFVINDKTTYDTVADFSSPENKKLFESIQKKQKQKTELIEKLEELRIAYHSAAKTEQDKMSQTIIKAERDIETLDNNIKKDIKTLRKNELLILKK